MSVRPSRPTLRIRVAAFFIFVAVRALFATCRIRIVGSENRQAAARSKNGTGGGYIIALWHETIMPAIMTHRLQEIRPMISMSGDGELVSQVALRLGYDPIRGSNFRGGHLAAEKMEHTLQKGGIGAITVDGPLGPRRKVKSGVAIIARTATAPILPLRVTIDRKWILKKTWDQFQIPMPFSCITIDYGMPINPPETADPRALVATKRALEESLNSL